MEKNKHQLTALLIVVVILVVATAAAVLKPRAKKAAKAANMVAASAMRQPTPQKERIKSSFSSWGRDPFAIGSSPVEQGFGSLSLSGIFCDSKKNYCIIDGKVVKVGDEVSGYKILEITKDNVTINAGDETRTLKLGR